MFPDLLDLMPSESQSTQDHRVDGVVLMSSESQNSQDNQQSLKTGSDASVSQGRINRTGVLKRGRAYACRISKHSRPPTPINILRCLRISRLNQPHPMAQCCLFSVSQDWIKQHSPALRKPGLFNASLPPRNLLSPRRRYCLLSSHCDNCYFQLQRFPLTIRCGTRGIFVGALDALFDLRSNAHRVGLGVLFLERTGERGQRI
jgi:hypothetical protein